MNLDRVRGSVKKSITPLVATWKEKRDFPTTQPNAR